MDGRSGPEAVRLGRERSLSLASAASTSAGGDLWSVREFHGAKDGLACWLRQLAAAGVGDRVQCLFYTFDHPELVGALREA